MAIDDGGPLFPAPTGEFVCDGDAPRAIRYRPIIKPGITLRDWYKGQALIGILSNQSLRADILHAGVGEEKAVAHYAGKCADAMIAERKEAGNDQ